MESNFVEYLAFFIFDIDILDEIKIVSYLSILVVFALSIL